MDTKIKENYHIELRCSNCDAKGNYYFAKGEIVKPYTQSCNYCGCHSLHKPFLTQAMG